MTMNSALLAPIIDLPAALRDREVDVIVLPKPIETKGRSQNSGQKKTERKSTMGCLNEYANPTLRELEKGAWERATVEKSLKNLDKIAQEKNDQ